MSVSFNYILDKAISIAVTAHDGQVDKLGKPYILHPINVMGGVTTTEQKIVAILHDVVEDTPTTLDDICKQFLGFGMSPRDVSKILVPLDLITKRKGIDYNDYLLGVKSNPISLAVKLSDIRHNTSPIRVQGLAPDFAKKITKKYKTALSILNN